MLARGVKVYGTSNKCPLGHQRKNASKRCMAIVMLIIMIAATTMTFGAYYIGKPT